MTDDPNPWKSSPPEGPQSLTGVVSPPDGTFAVKAAEQLTEGPLETAQRIAREALEANDARIAELRTERTGLNEQLRIDREKLNTTAKDRREAINAEIARLDAANKPLRKMLLPDEDE